MAPVADIVLLISSAASDGDSTPWKGWKNSGWNAAGIGLETGLPLLVGGAGLPMRGGGGHVGAGTVERDMEIAGIERPSKDLVARVREVGAATASATLAHMGLRNCFMAGPVARMPGAVVAGPFVTLQMMPKREDLYQEGEYADVETQLHRHVLYQVEDGDIVVVDARGDLGSGIFGDMMMTYFKGLKGAGVVIDGCVRDWAKVQKLGIPMWLKGVTPNYHAQTALMPMAVNVPVACGGVTVIPGDIIVADDDGAVCVPVALAGEMVKKAHKDHGWEEFSREKLLAGESLKRYYPLHKDAWPEYEAWLAARGKQS
jgi:regulator of RNase E activity RraA